MSVCQSCGTVNPDQAFCGSCGAKLAPPAVFTNAPPSPIVVVPHSATDSLANTPLSPIAPPPAKARPKWLVPAIGVGVLALVGGAIAASKGDSSTSTESVAQTQTSTKATTKPTQPATTVLSCPAGQHATPFGHCEDNATTTIKSEKGTRDNPFSPYSLTFGDYDPVSFGLLEPVDTADIMSANQFNDEPPLGQIYVRYKVTATYNGTSNGSYSDFAFNLGLVGDKGKIYESAFVSDVHGDLQTLQDQPDVISGGSLVGYLYYLIDADDTNILIVNANSDGNVFIDIRP